MLLECIRVQALSLAQQSAGDEDAYDYNALLRHGIFEAYSGILNGMSKGMSSKHLTQVAPVRAPAQRRALANCRDVRLLHWQSAAYGNVICSSMVVSPYLPDWLGVTGSG